MGRLFVLVHILVHVLVARISLFLVCRLPVRLSNKVSMNMFEHVLLLAKCFKITCDVKMPCTQTSWYTHTAQNKHTHSPAQYTLTALYKQCHARYMDLYTHSTIHTHCPVHTLPYTNTATFKSLICPCSLSAGSVLVRLETTS